MVPDGSIKTTRRVLLVENSTSDRRTLKGWLTAEGIQVHEATDLVSGLAACPTVQPNLIILQLRLPGGDGFEVIRRLKDDPDTVRIPVIFLSSNSTTSEKARGIDMGAVDFVSKPFDPIELLARANSALRTKAYLDLLEHRAHIDGLTELSNRCALSDRLPRVWEACTRRELPLTVLVADLDHFKEINDRFGHAAGDEVLRRVAATLRDAVREDHFVARYGGEEFVVLAPGCEVAGAVAMAERFRRSVADLKIKWRSASLSLTVSVGVARGLDPSQSEPVEALEQADRALYQAKEAGRDAVWVWDPGALAAVAAKEAKTVRAATCPC
jgi:diguanylate cyclase (GGDEF)-like protein